MTKPPGFSIRQEHVAPCPECRQGLVSKTTVARLPRQKDGKEWTEVRKVHLECVPSDSPDYARARAELQQ